MSRGARMSVPKLRRIPDGRWVCVGCGHVTDGPHLAGCPPKVKRRRMGKSGRIAQLGLPLDGVSIDIRDDAAVTALYREAGRVALARAAAGLIPRPAPPADFNGEA